MTTTGNNTIILGAGIIGTATAYYLSLSPDTPAQSIHLVETTPELFSSASGYAGGFLAKDCAFWTHYRKDASDMLTILKGSRRRWLSWEH